jgi:hypothetical protein
MRTASVHAPGCRPRRNIAALLLPAAALIACNSAAPAKSADSARLPAAANASPTATPASAAAAPTLVVYKTPTCGCCKAWVSAMEDAGFTVETHDVADLAPVKHAAGVPSELQACHTARIGGYVVEGHVPAADIRRLLAERADIAGIATPGMPAGSPGMEGAYKDRYDVMTFGIDRRTTVFASH